MATYVPATLITAKAFGNGSGNISTWQKQNTAGSSTFDVYRTVAVVTSTGARTVTLEQGPTGTAVTTQRIVDAYALTANVQYVLNCWIAVPNNGYFQGYANNTDINGGAYGYTYS